MAFQSVETVSGLRFTTKLQILTPCGASIRFASFGITPSLLSCCWFVCWQFWIGVLLAISFGASLLTATAPPSQPTSISSPDSYFI